VSTVVRGRVAYPTDGKACARCLRRTLPADRWRKVDKATREAWRADGLVAMDSRGLCRTCYSWATKHGKRLDYERRNVPTAELLEEWEHLADPLRPVLEEVKRLAPRLGMKEKTLAQALHRGGVRSRFEGGHGERVKAA